MALFGCNYLETQGGIFPEYICGYSRRRIESRTASDICMTSRYQDCEDFKRASGCFITTAVCFSLGKPDDCEKLRLIRNFRDTWLREQPEGKKLIEEYYQIAPQIVEAIDKISERNEIYREIYGDYIVPCIEMIQAKHNKACLAIYQAMVYSLKHYIITK